MWTRPLPDIPPALDGLTFCATGEAARFLQGEPPPRTPPSLLIEADEATLLSRPDVVQAPGRQGLFLVGRWQARCAPDGLIAGLKRRHVPADAIGVRPDGEALDPLGGLGALRQRSVGAVDVSLISDDPGLLARWLATASSLDCVSRDLRRALEESPEALWRMPRSDLRAALTDMLVGRGAGPAMDAMVYTRAMGFVLPEVAAFRDFHKSSRFHHKDLWAHTRQVVVQAVPRPLIRWAALMHDIGKIFTRGYGPGRKVHFLRHEELGAYMFEGIATRLEFPPEMAERLRLLVLHHLRPGLYSTAWSDSAVRRFTHEMGDLFDDLLLLSRADVTSKRAGRRREAMFHLHGLKTRVQAVAAADALRKPAVPKGLGRAIIQDLGVAPGPEVGRLRRLCEQAVRAGELPGALSIDRCLEWLRAHAS